MSEVLEGSPGLQIASPTSDRDLQKLEAMTFSRYRELLRTPSASVRYCCATQGSRPVALALGSDSPSGFQVLSIYVQNPFRRRGVASALLQSLEATVRTDFPDCPRLFLTYTTRQPRHRELERLIDGQGWRHPVDTSLFGLISLDNVKQQHLWIHHRIPPLPQRMRFVPWQEVTPALHKKMRSLLAEEESAASCDPDANIANRMDSIGGVLLEKDEVAGWMAHHRSSALPGVIRYGPLFTRPGYRMRGLSMRLWYYTLSRHVALESERFPQMMVDIAVGHNADKRFQRRYAPYMDEVFSSRRAEKPLQGMVCRA